MVWMLVLAGSMGGGMVQPGEGSKPAEAKPAAHPTITEVLYAVPGGRDGDANRDGRRASGGDEFVEIANLTDKAINLKGYRLVDSNAWEAEQVKAPEGKPGESPERPGAPRKRPPADAPGEHVRLVFPDVELKPGQVAVVFNGCESAIPGPVGDQGSSAGPNEKFGGALVFSMRVASNYAAFGNDGDWVALCAPDGSLVQCLWWGLPKVERPAEWKSVAELPPGNASVRLTGPGGTWVGHRARPGMGEPFSPGVFAPDAGGSPVKKGG
jgi:hypothetical protein